LSVFYAHSFFFNIPGIQLIFLSQRFSLAAPTSFCGEVKGDNEATLNINHQFHPNIVKVFVMTKVENSYMGVVMEFADKDC
jgi:hypothetical protein